jgi:hypothetical protein
MGGGVAGNFSRQKTAGKNFCFDCVGPGKFFAATGIRPENFPVRTGYGRKKSPVITLRGPGYFPVAGN